MAVHLGQNNLGGSLYINGRAVPETATPSQSTPKASTTDLNALVSAQTAPSSQSAGVAQTKPAAGADSVHSTKGTLPTSPETDKHSVSTKFFTEMKSRLAAAEGGKNPKHVDMLAKGLMDTAEEIKRHFGQEKANEFMSQILITTDKSVDERSLTTAISGFFRPMVAQANTDSTLEIKLGSMMKSLNEGLSLSLYEGDELKEKLDDSLINGKDPGLSYSLNQYFGVEATIADDEKSAKTMGFNSSFERVEMQVHEEQNDEFFTIYSGTNVAPANLNISSEIINDVATFLRDDVGNENAAAHMDKIAAKLEEKDAPAPDFLKAVATAMAIVAEENGQEAAHSFKDFLNKDISPYIKTSSGNLSVQEWNIGTDYANPDAPSGGPPPGHIWLGGENGKEIQNKGHQGLTTNWVDKNGVGSSVELDMDELYAEYLKSLEAQKAQAAETSALPEADKAQGVAKTNLNNPTGNMVDTTI